MKLHPFVFLLLLAIAAHPAYSASNRVILLDKSTLTPIAGATYHYDARFGVSDSLGIVKFEYNPSDTLFISHVSYGKWELSGKELSAAIETGFIYRNMVVLQLQPMTSITIHPDRVEEQRVSLEAQDRLAHDITSILTNTPMICSIRKGGNYGFDPVMRGFKYDQLNVVIDGVQTAVAACANRMDPPTSHVVPNMIENVEIFKGPHSFRFGTPFGGTINFVSAPPKFTRETNSYGRWSNSAEGNGGIYRTEGMMGLSGQLYNFRMFGSFSRGNDYSAGNNIEIPAAFNRASVGSTVGLSLSGRKSLVLSATRDYARDTDFPALPMDMRKDDSSLFDLQYMSRYNGKYLSAWNTTVYGSFVRHLMDNLSKQINPRMMDASSDARSKSLGGRTEGTWNISDGLFYTGFDISVESAEGDRTRQFESSLTKLLNFPVIFVLKGDQNYSQIPEGLLLHSLLAHR